MRCGELGASESVRCGVPMPLQLLTGSIDASAAVSAGRMIFHADNAADCLDSVKHAPCDATQAAADFVRHCHGVVSGNVSVGGGPCFGDEECVGGLCVGADCGGRCDAFAPTGGACLVLGGTAAQTCDPTVHYCDGAACRRKKQLGDGCAADVECAFDDACLGGKCAEPPRTHRDDVCGTRSPPCEDGLYCDENGLCAPRKKQGDPCTRADSCSDGLVCVAGSCSAWLDAGGVCSAATPTVCPASQACSAGSCTPAMTGVKVGPQSHCSVDGDCADGLFCASGYCAYRGGVEAACSADHECAAGLVCGASKSCGPPVSCPAAR